MDRVTEEKDFAKLKARLAEAEETLRAIYEGEVDAVVVAGPDGDQIFTLQGAERPYRLLIEAMNEGALTLDSDGTVLYCNSRFAEMVDKPMEKVIGSEWQLFFPPEDQGPFQALLDGARTQGHKGEFALLTSKGDRTPVQISARTMQLEGVGAFAILVTDLTQRKRAEEELQRANVELAVGAAKLQETVAELEAFSYTISHDLRAPLRAIQSFAGILREQFGAKMEPEAMEYLARSASAAARMDQLIKDVLNYSQTSRAELVLGPVDLDRLTREVIVHHPDFRHTEIMIAGELPTVIAHEASLAQCISNLLGNAVKFVTPGATPKVQIRAEQREERVRLWVEDNGIGISPHHQQRIFGIFERLQPAGAYAGTGIGLSIVKKAVERMGGSVGVESEPGQGSRFWIELPAA